MQVVTFGIIPNMTAEGSRLKFPRILLEIVIAVALIAGGAAGLSSAVHQRPYLGQPATALIQVPLRVVAEPNVPALALFLGSLGAIVTGAAWFVLRLVHQVFFKPVGLRRVWRETIFVAIFVVGVAWLQLNQAFSLALAAAIAVALILLEMFLNIRERLA